MPGNFMQADVGMPYLSRYQSTGDKLRAIQDYLYMLLEQLRYTLNNLGEENFNEAGLREITDPINNRITDAEGNMSAISQTAEEIKAQVTDAEGNYTVVNLKSDGLHIGNAAGTTTIDGGSITANSIHLAMLGSDVRNSFGDANPGYIKSTYIDATQLSAPLIRANNFEVVVGYGSHQGGYFIYPGSQQQNPAFAIQWYDDQAEGHGGVPTTEITMPWGGTMNISNSELNLFRLNKVVLYPQPYGTAGGCYGSTLPPVSSMSQADVGRIFFQI